MIAVQRLRPGFNPRNHCAIEIGQLRPCFVRGSGQMTFNAFGSTSNHRRRSDRMAIDVYGQVQPRSPLIAVNISIFD